MSRRPALRDSAVGTTWRTIRSLLFVMLILVIVYTLFSAAVAVSTADKCDGQLRADKTWNFLPPRWDCVTTQPGPGG
ncbi:MAG TPA: hypothetical protein VGJ03_06460 [Acidimicrobiales bacterium]|jgi:hypothetical protein